MHLHAYLLHQSGVEDGATGKAAPVNHAVGVEDYFIGYGAEVVRAARIAIAVGNDPFAALLELQHSLTQLVQVGRIATQRACLEVDAFHAVVLGCLLDGIKCLVQTDGGLLALVEEVHRAAFAGTLYDFGVKRDAQHAVLGNGGSCSFAGYHACNGDDTDNGKDDAGQDDAHHRGQRVLEKVFHRSLYKSVI